MSTAKIPLLRIVRMHFRPDVLPDFMVMFQETQPKIAEMPGCLSVELKQDIAQPHVVYTLSHWESEADLNAYRRSDLFVQDQNQGHVFKTAGFKPALTRKVVENFCTTRCGRDGGR